MINTFTAALSQATCEKILYSLETLIHNPGGITDTMLQGCNQLGPGVPFMVKRSPVPGALPQKCVPNVDAFLKGHPGEMILGWDIRVWDDVLLDCTGHAIVKNGDVHTCISPNNKNTTILFLPDATLTFDFENPMCRMPYRQIALSKLPDVTRLIDAEKAISDIRRSYPRQSGYMYVTDTHGIQLKKLEKRTQQLTMKVLIASSTADTPCACKSGKTLHSCCMPNMKKMLLA